MGLKASPGGIPARRGPRWWADATLLIVAFTVMAVTPVALGGPAASARLPVALAGVGHDSASGSPGIPLGTSQPEVQFSKASSPSSLKPIAGGSTDSGQVVAALNSGASALGVIPPAEDPDSSSNQHLNPPTASATNPEVAAVSGPPSAETLGPAAPSQVLAADSPAVPLAVTATLTVDGSSTSTSIDTGQTLTYVASIGGLSNGGCSYWGCYFQFQDDGTGGTAFDSGSCYTTSSTNSETWTDSTLTTVGTYVVGDPPPGGSPAYETTIYDAASCSQYYDGLNQNTVSVTVNSALVAGTASANPATADVGQSVTLTATAPTGGTSAYKYQWLAGASATCTSDSVVAGQTSSTYALTASASEYFCMEYGDSSTGTPAAVAYSNVVHLIVDPDPTVAISPTGGTTSYDMGQTASVITSTITYSGPNTATTTFYSSSSAGACSNTGSWSSTGISGGTGTTYLPSTASVGTLYFCAVVTDSGVAAYLGVSGVETVTVHADPTVSISPTGTTLEDDVGQTASTLTATVSYSGSNTITTTWYTSSSASTCTTVTSVGTGATYVPSTAATGTTDYCAVVTDSGVAGYNSASGVEQVVVTADPTVGASPPGPFDYDVGQTAAGLSATVTYSGPNTATVKWYDSASSSCSGSSTYTGTSGASFTPSTTAAGTVYYCAVVFDSGVPSYSSASGAIQVVVAADPTVSVSPAGPLSYDVEQSSSSLTAAISYAGSNTATLEWFSSGTASCTTGSTNLANSATTLSPSTSVAGTTYYCVAVYDSGVPSYSSISNAVKVTVSADPTVGASPSGTDPGDVGEALVLTATVTYSGSNSDPLEWYSSASASCSASSTNLGVTTTTYDPSTAATGTVYYCVVVTDGGVPGYSSASNAVAVTISADPTVSVGPAGPLAYDVGQTSATLTATVTYSGSNSATVKWYDSATSACSDASTYTGTTGTTLAPPTSTAGTTYYCAVVVDSGVPSYSDASSAVKVTVTADPTVSVSPAGPLVYDEEQAASTLTATITYGGPNSAPLKWYSSATSACSSSSTSTGVTSATFTPSTSSAGTTYYCAVVTDSGVASYSYASNAVEVTVNVDVSLAAVAETGPVSCASSCAADAGQVLRVDTIANLGTSGYTFTWTVTAGSADCSGSASGAVTSTYSCTVGALASSQTWTVSVYVEDSALCYYPTSGSSCSGPPSAAQALSFTVTLNPDPTATQHPAIFQRNESGQTNNFTAHATSGTPGYTYQWYLNGTVIAGATSSLYAFKPAHPGNYSVNLSVTDAVGWVVWTSAVYELTTLGPAVTLTAQRAETDVNVNVEVYGNFTGGVLPIVLSFTVNTVTVQSSSTLKDYNLTESTPGSYTVVFTETDVNHASATQTVTIVVNPLPTAALAPSAPVIDTGQSVTLTETATGGTGPYTYIWFVNGAVQSGQTASTFLFSGTSTSQVSAALNDTFDKPAKASAVTVTVHADPTMTISSPRSAIDSGQTLTFTGVTALGTSPYSCQWYVNGTAVIGATTCGSFLFVPSGPGAAWTVKAEVTDSVGVTESSTVSTITVNPGIRLSVTAPGVVGDIGQSITLTAAVAGGTPSYTCQWMANGVAIASATSCSSLKYNLTAAGSVSIVLHVTDSVFNQTNSTAKVLTINVDPALTLTAVTPGIDKGETANVSAIVSGGTSGFTCTWWINGAKQASSSCLYLTFLGATITNDSVNATVKDAVGFVAASGIVVVAVAPPPAARISPATRNVDANQPTTFLSDAWNGTGALTCQWAINGTATGVTSCTTYLYTPTGVGTFLVEFETTDRASPAEHAWANATVVAGPALVLGVSPTSWDIDLGMSATFTMTASGGSGGLVYGWTGLPAGCTATATPGLTCAPSSAGSYTISAEVNDTNGNLQHVTVTILDAPLPTVQVTPPGPLQVSAGEGESLNATVSGGTGPFTITWIVDGVTQSETGSSYTFLSGNPGLHTVVASITDVYGRGDNSTRVDITVVKLAAVLTAPSAGEVGVGISLSAAASGGTGPYDYTWYANGAKVGTSTTDTYLWVPGTAGSESLVVSVVDTSDGLTTNSTAVSVTIVPAVTVSLTAGSSSTDVNVVDLLTTTIGSGRGAFTTAFTIGGTAWAPSGSSPYSWTPKVAGSTNVSVTVTDSLGGVAHASLLVQVNPSPTVDLAANITAIDLPSGSAELTATVSGGTSPFTYVWSQNGTVITGADEATYLFSSSTPGVYGISVKVTDAAGVTVSSHTESVQVFAASAHNPGGSGGGLLGLPDWLWLVLIAAIIGLLLLVVIVGRRRRQPEASETDVSGRPGSSPSVAFAEASEAALPAAGVGASAYAAGGTEPWSDAPTSPDMMGSAPDTGAMYAGPGEEVITPVVSTPETEPEAAPFTFPPPPLESPPSPPTVEEDALPSTPEPPSPPAPGPSGYEVPPPPVEPEPPSTTTEPEAVPVAEPPSAPEPPSPESGATSTDMMVGAAAVATANALSPAPAPPASSEGPACPRCGAPLPTAKSECLVCAAAGLEEPRREDRRVAPPTPSPPEPSPPSPAAPAPTPVAVAAPVVVPEVPAPHPQATMPRPVACFICGGPLEGDAYCPRCGMSWNDVDGA